MVNRRAVAAKKVKVKHENVLMIRKTIITNMERLWLGLLTLMAKVAMTNSVK